MYRCASECLNVYHTKADVYRGQNRAADHMELELQAVLSYLVGAGNKTWVFCKKERLVKD